MLDPVSINISTSESSGAHIFDCPFFTLFTFASINANT
jgi:hypothetical protein